jgi:hypothetical protein
MAEPAEKSYPDRLIGVLMGIVIRLVTAAMEISAPGKTLYP